MSCRVDKRSRAGQRARKRERKREEKGTRAKEREGEKSKGKEHEDRQQSRTKIIHTEKPKLFINVPSKERESPQEPLPIPLPPRSPPLLLAAQSLSWEIDYREFSSGHFV